MRINLDLVACKAYANCIIEAPDVFDYDDANGKAVLLLDEVGDDRAEEVQRAAASCPANAITVLE